MAHVVRSSSRQLFTFAKRILVSQQESIILTRAHSYTVSDALIYFFGFQMFFWMERLFFHLQVISTYDISTKYDNKKTFRPNQIAQIIQMT